MKKVPVWKVVVPIAIGLVIYLMPVPQGLAPNAWNYFALFTAVIAALILEPIPAAAVGLIGVTLAAVLLLVTDKPATSLRWLLSGFTNGTVWLIFIAFMFAMGYEKTGLGRRLALMLVKTLGKSTLGLGYAVAFTDLVLAPFTPSNTARSGGTIYPIIKNIPPIYGSLPNDPSCRKIGAYLMWTAMAITCVTSSMFITALAPNLLALALVQKASAALTFTWTEWFLGFLPIGVVLFLAVPYLVYKIYPPEVTHSENVPTWAKDELAKMGGISRREITMALLALCALTLWIFGKELGGIDATTAALVVFCSMIITGVVSWDDVVSNKQAWNVLVWFATLVTLADGLRLVKFLSWFATITAAAMKGMSVEMVIIGLVAVFFLVHYMFASLTAHTTALLPVFMVAAMAVPGMPVKLIALMFCYSLGIMGILTPFATGPSPIYYGSGYIPSADFWRLGTIFGIIYLVVFLAIGYPYLSMIMG